jgi:hypothetical protein
MDAPEPRRFSVRLPRPLWIGIAALVMIGSAVALQFGLPVYRQQTAIHEIERLGGQIKSRPRGPRWLRDRLGYDNAELLNVVFFVALSNTCDDTILLRLKAFPELETLSATRSRVSDAGLSHLTGQTRLEWLGLGGTQITDEGLTHIRNLPNLRSLYLESTQVTDKGLVHLQGLTNLEVLSLRDTRVTEAGISELRHELPNLIVYR